MVNPAIPYQAESLSLSMGYQYMGEAPWDLQSYSTFHVSVSPRQLQMSGVLTSVNQNSCSKQSQTIVSLIDGSQNTKVSGVLWVAET
jgi:hypothetical protein